MDIRETYRKFPNKTQHFFTWVTGKALPHQQPLIHMNWMQYLLIMLSLYLGGLVFAFFSFSDPLNLSLLLISWGMVVFSSRRMAAVILHQCVHHRFSGKKKIDRFIGELVTTLMMTQDFVSYQIDHCKLHHAPKSFATEEDPIVIFFTSHGIKRGLSKKRLWWNFFLTIISPKFHIKFFIARLKYNFNSKSLLRKIASFVYVALWLGLIISTNSGVMMFLTVFFIPVVVLYQVSAFVEICSEHAWYKPHKKNLPKKYFYVERSWGRFCGSAYPGNNFPKNIKWFLENVFYHLPVRLFILVGDLPQHDYHHRKPLTDDWAIADYKRQEHIDNKMDDEPDYSEIWGLHSAISHVFSILENCDDNKVLTS